MINAYNFPQDQEETAVLYSVDSLIFGIDICGLQYSV